MNLFCFLFCFSRQTKQIFLFVFWENIRRTQTAFGFIWPLASNFKDPFSVFKIKKNRYFMIWSLSKSTLSLIEKYHLSTQTPIILMLLCFFYWFFTRYHITYQKSWSVKQLSLILMLINKGLTYFCFHLITNQQKKTYS